MKNSSLALGAAVLSLIVTGGLAATSNAFTPNDSEPPAFSQGQPQFDRSQGQNDRNRRPQHNQIKEILENNDYEAWKELMSDKPMFENKLNEETFNKLVEAYRLREAGDIEGAKAIMEELGIKPPQQNRHPGKQGKKKGHFKQMKKILEAQDYEAWQELMENNPRFDENLINEDTFNKLLEAHELMQSGDHEGAKAIMEELGFGPRK